MSDHATLRDAIIYFSDFEHCKQLMMDLRWWDGKVKCPVCGAEKLTYLAKRRVWKCYNKHVSPTFSLKTGTIFEDSPIPLEKWLHAAWMLINCKNGISSWELHRGLGVTQKTAWFMLQRIRLATQDQTQDKLAGEVEVDETFIGGKARNMHASERAEKITGRGPEGKAIVAAVLERGGTVRAQVCSTRRKPELQAMIRENVEAGSAVYSDALKSYEGLDDFAHQVVDHAVAYVDGNIHTNNCENFWSLLKRSLKGTYVAVEPFHLFRYIDEQAFRYNNRNMNDIERFVYVMRHIVGRRLTYKQLTGREGRNNMAGRPKTKAAGAGEADDRPPMTAEQFEASPEFRKFNIAMRRILKVSKVELDKRIQHAKAASARAGNPNAPGRKRRVSETRGT